MPVITIEVVSVNWGYLYSYLYKSEKNLAVATMEAPCLSIRNIKQSFPDSGINLATLQRWTGKKALKEKQ